jgi:hypothetical protein
VSETQNEKITFNRAAEIVLEIVVSVMPMTAGVPFQKGSPNNAGTWLPPYSKSRGEGNIGSARIIDINID